MTEANRRATFDRAAASYLTARPAYPPELFDDLISLTGITPADSLLEVGCGPGVATVALARRGFGITAIELGQQLADQARANLAEFPAVSVVTSSFEDWEPAHGSGADVSVDLIYAATAWHWVDPAVRYVKAAPLLKPGGHLAVWGAGHAMPVGFDPFFTEIQAVYDEIGAGHPGEWPGPTPDQVPGLEAECAASGLFDVVGVRRYVWAIQYAVEAYLALLDTFSGHIAMDPAKRDHLYAEIRRRFAERSDGLVTRHWMSILTVGRRRSATG